MTAASPGKNKLNIYQVNSIYGYMRVLIGIILIISLMGSGCLEMIMKEKVPVLYINMSVDEDPSGSMIIKEISAQGGEVSKVQAPEGEYPEDFPAYYVSVQQKMNVISKPAGKDYKGPGNYVFVVGFTPEFNKSLPLAISARGVEKGGNYSIMHYMYINWTTDIQKKTFK